MKVTNIDQSVDVLVVFGITGDLAHKMTIPALYRLEQSGYLSCQVVGVALEPWSQDRLVEEFKVALGNDNESVDQDTLESLFSKVSYVHGDFSDHNTYLRLKDVVGKYRNPLYYLEIPPSLFAPVIHELASVGLADKGRFLIEKPFGTDLSSAKTLNDTLHRVIAEEQILRIDHFLGKQPVLDISYLRFANEIIEPMLSREHVDSIQVTMAEDFGVEDRGSFYDKVGAVRDVVQNHLLQVLSLMTMEIPTSNSYGAIWDKKADLLKAVTPMNPKTTVFGQYEGYLDVPGVGPHSKTETYVATEVAIENWRWHGVPVFIRAGKALSVRSTELRVIFKRAPHLPYVSDLGDLPPNEMILRIDPNPSLRLQLASKDAVGSRGRSVSLDLPFEEELGKLPLPYERLIHNALIGDYSLFTREDSVEESWRIVQPLLDPDKSVIGYKKGSFGPSDADALCKGHLCWQTPWM